MRGSLQISQVIFFLLRSGVSVQASVQAVRLESESRSRHLSRLSVNTLPG